MSVCVCQRGYMWHVVFQNNFALMPSSIGKVHLSQASTWLDIARFFICLFFPFLAFFYFKYPFGIFPVQVCMTCFCVSPWGLRANHRQQRIWRFSSFKPQQWIVTFTRLERRDLFFCWSHAPLQWRYVHYPCASMWMWLEPSPGLIYVCVV